MLQRCLLVIILGGLTATAWANTVSRVLHLATIIRLDDIDGAITSVRFSPDQLLLNYNSSNQTFQDAHTRLLVESSIPEAKYKDNALNLFLTKNSGRCSKDVSVSSDDIGWIDGADESDKLHPEIYINDSGAQLEIETAHSLGEFNRVDEKKNMAGDYPVRLHFPTKVGAYAKCSGYISVRLELAI